MVLSYNDDFEVTWKDAAAAASTWTHDTIHYPYPLPPLSQEFMAVNLDVALDSGSTVLNGYIYIRDFHLLEPTPDEVRRGAADIWFNDYQHRMRAVWEAVSGRDYDAMAAEHLAAELGPLFHEVGEAIRCTITVVPLLLEPARSLVDFCEQELDEEGPRLAATILQGFANESADAGQALGELAELAERSPELAEALRQGRFDGLELLVGGDEFRRQFDEYLDQYGWRLESWSLIHKPTWREEPAQALKLIGRHLSTPGFSAAAVARRTAEQRERTLAEVESRLAKEKLDEFRDRYAAARDYVSIREGRAFWQLTVNGSLRAPLSAMGRKLVEAGVIQEPDDVCYLSLQEVREAAADPSKSRTELVASRKVDLERWSRLTPPPFIGSPPSAPPPERISLFRHVRGAGPPSIEGQTIRGQPASAGVVRGPARIVRSLSESDSLQHGDILVCQTTAAPWTSLFSIAAGVVTDTGGVLSHSAICAREYAIPCVVATQVATSTIPDGAMITIDGSKGTVVIEGYLVSRGAKTKGSNE